MARKHFTTEQSINMLREAEVFLSQGTPIAQACKKLGISEQMSLTQKLYTVPRTHCPAYSSTGFYSG